ncbi:MAG: glycosyltransferase [Thiolinea sp.]
MRAYAQEPAAIGLPGRYIVAVGRLEQQKRIDRLLEAFARSRLRKTHQLLILGEGSLRQPLELQVQALGLTGQVLMPGNVANPHPDVLQADFLVLASDHEGFPMVLIEALALGKPVISTDCATGPNEIIRHEHNGLLVVLDAVALAAAMDRLSLDRQLHAHMAAHAAESVAHLSIERIAERWLEL